MLSRFDDASDCWGFGDGDDVDNGYAAVDNDDGVADMMLKLML